MHIVIAKLYTIYYHPRSSMVLFLKSNCTRLSSLSSNWDYYPICFPNFWTLIAWLASLFLCTRVLYPNRNNRAFSRKLILKKKKTVLFTLFYRFFIRHGFILGQDFHRLFRIRCTCCYATFPISNIRTYLFWLVDPVSRRKYVSRDVEK